MSDETHFSKLFWFCVGAVTIGIGFLMALCFIPIPKSSEPYAQNVQGFIEGSVVTAALSFLLGGNLPTKKPTTPTVLQTGDAPVNNITSPNSTGTPVIKQPGATS